MFLALLFRALLLGDIDRGADVLDHLARAVQNRMPPRTEGDHSGIEAPEPVLDFQIGTVAHCFHEAFHGWGAVVRAKLLRYLLQRRQAFCRIEAVDAITLIRPIQNGIRSGAPCPASGVTDLLRLCQVLAAAPQ